MKQPLLITIGVIVVAVVAFLLFRSEGSNEQVLEETPLVVSEPVSQGGFTAIAPETTPNSIVASTSPAAANSVSVSIEDTAFDPATLTISVGDTVVFTNNGQALHWPASDPHPVHTGLAGFDAKKGLATGETYSYTFTEAGTYGMHDHLNAQMKGTIIVE